MAQVKFRSTVIWDDATTGRGRVEAYSIGGTERWMFEDYPKGDGRQAKDLGLEPGTVQLRLQYWWSDAERATHRTTLNGLKGLEGTLELPDGEQFQYCVMSYRDLLRGVPIEVAGVVKRASLLQLQFERLRG